ncbi:MAG: thermonuclease family protein [Thermodesulfobacteriota bacterium]
MKNRSVAKWFLPLLILAVAAGYGGVSSRLSGNGARTETFTVTRVIDGDTIGIRAKNGRKYSLRYEGIDCPEVARKNSPGDPLSEEATRLNAKLVENKTVRVRFGEQGYDRYGRLLGFVFAGETNVSAEILRAGLATVFEMDGQDTAMMDKFRAAAKEAKKSRRGIWSGDGNFKPHESHKDFVIPQSELPSRVGERVVIRALITGAKRKRNGMVILDTDGGAGIVIFSNASENFKHFGIKPRTRYKGKQVQIAGRVSMYRGKPNIIVSHPASIYVRK